MIFNPNERASKGNRVVYEGEAEGLTYCPGTFCECGIHCILLSPLKHGGDSEGGIDGADEDCVRDPLFVGNDVE